MCANNRTFDFICPNGTIFHQAYLVCVWWNQFDCNLAPSLFEVNFNNFEASRQVNGTFGSTPTGSAPVGSAPVGSAPVGSTPLGSAPLDSSNDFKQFYQSPQQQLPLSDQENFEIDQRTTQQGYPPSGQFPSGQIDGSRQVAQTNINTGGYSSQQPAPFSKKFSSSQEPNFNDLRKYLPPHQNGY